MVILKCKMCGRDVQTTNGAYATCEYCGAMTMIQKSDDEKTFAKDVSDIVPKKFSNETINNELAELNKAMAELKSWLTTIPSIISSNENRAAHWRAEKMKYYNQLVGIEGSIRVTSSKIWKDFNEWEGDALNIARELEEMRIGKLNLKSEYESKISTLEASIRLSPVQRAEKHYQSLLAEKNAITNEREFPELAKKFREMEGYKDSEALAKECEELVFKVQYDRFVQDKNRASTEDEYRDLVKKFRKIRNYKDSETLAKECDELAFKVKYDRLVQAKNRASTEAEYWECANYFKAMNGYKDTAELAGECDNAAVRIRYDLLVQKKNNASTEEEYQELAKQFSAMNGYENTIGLASECDNAATRTRYNLLVQKKNNASTEEEYQELAKQFRAMSGYENTVELANECDNAAMKARYDILLQEKNKASTEEEYQKVADLFKAMNGYEDTAELASKCDEQYHTIKEHRIKEEKRKARNELILKMLKRCFILGIGILLLCVVIVTIMNMNNNKSSKDTAESAESPKSELFYIPITSSNGFYKYITLNGKNITEAKYIRAYVFQEGRALVQHRDSLWGYIDTKGNSIASGYKQGLSFKDGMAWVNDKGIIKALDLNGNIIKTLSSDVISIWSFYEGFALFSMNGSQSYIDKDYNAIGNWYADGNRFQENVASVMCDNGKYGYINTEASFVIKCNFDEAKTFRNSRAIVRVGDKWGVINKQGKYIFGPFSDVEMINPDDDIFKFKKKNGGWGWLNSEGKVIIQPFYDEVMSFDDRDIAPVRQGDKWGYIDKKGAYASNMQYNVAYPFFNNRALVKIDDDFITIDRKGRQGLRTGSQKLDPSYWGFINTGIAGGPRIMTVEPSFKCSAANLSNSEKIICRSVKLSNLDKTVDELYKRSLRNNKSTANSQKEFLAKRNKCNDARCIESAYEARRHKLSN
jgi:DNA-directed RNA polymerase subunit RPC12/RpoP